MAQPAAQTACAKRAILCDPTLLRHQGYVDGAWTDGSGAAPFAVTDPSDGAVVGTVAALSAGDTAVAIAAARRAFADWRRSLPAARGRTLAAWHSHMLAARDDLARLIVLEQGKPLAEAQGEVDYAADFVAWYAAEAERIGVESIASPFADAVTELRREPVGVAALLTPWNFPLAMITRKAAAALAAGCTAVVHPSCEAPFSALALAELADRAGLPAGTFNVVPGAPGEIGPALCGHPDIRAVSFTGSTEVGRLVAAQCAATVKTTILELGGHAPFVVCADADLDAAVDAAMPAKFATSGQDCLAANRFLVHRTLYDPFVARFAERMQGLTVGHGFAPGVDIGPLINARAVAKAEAHVADAVERGARLVTGGARHRAGAQFFQPTLLANVPPEALIWREETFAPVAAVAAFDDDDTAIRIANDTVHGLVAYVHARAPERIERFQRELDYGMVAVNRTKLTGAPVPFGGVKQSGLGREGGRHGLEAFTVLKYICRQGA
ncbi:MAG: NAD-dependent succinate-semialdehyde dehydrogenase [Alphaproteobacteria bacterium]